MSQAAKANEPSMEEILASIRRIISDDDAPEGAAAPAKDAKADKAAAAKAAEKPAAEPAASAPSSQDDIDALLASFDEPDSAPPKKEEPKKPEAKKVDVKPAAKAAEPAKDDKGGGSQDDIDALLASFDAEVAEPDPPAQPAVKVEEDDVLDLVDAVDLEAETEAAAEAVTEAPEADLAEDDGWGLVAEDEEEAPAPPPEPAVAAAPAAVAAAMAAPVAAVAKDGLLSQEASVAVSSAFSSLGNLFLASNSRTIEGLVEDMLRPMLKSWLDENLPGMVERMVKSEIERITRGR